MNLLGLLLGAALSAAALPPLWAMPPLWGRAVALLGGAALLFVLGSVLFSSDSLTRSFGSVYLTVGLLAAVLLALPRLLRYAGQEPVWVGLGVGLACLLLLLAVGVGLDALLGLLLPENPASGESVRAQISQGLSNGLIFAAPVVVVVLSVLAWRGRSA